MRVSGRKHGRQLKSPAMAAYRAEMRWIKNKMRKVVRHFKLHPKDNKANHFISSGGKGG